MTGEETGNDERGSREGRGRARKPGERTGLVTLVALAHPASGPPGYDGFFPIGVGNDE
jgi:hypothetical protein